jgi:hypothetical protein
MMSLHPGKLPNGVQNLPKILKTQTARFFDFRCAHVSLHLMSQAAVVYPKTKGDFSYD